MAVNQAIRSIGNGREKYNKVFVFFFKKEEEEKRRREPDKTGET
jgi:hypothetical protein